MNQTRWTRRYEVVRDYLLRNAPTLLTGLTTVKWCPTRWRETIVYPNGFSAVECHRLLGQMSQLPHAPATVRAEQTLEPSTRSATLRFFHHTPLFRWVWSKLAYFATDANQTLRLGPLQGINSLQFAEYHEGDHYTWHPDVSTGIFQHRRLSLVAVLATDGALDTYLQFWDHRAVIPVGGVIAFPSYLEHRVLPVRGYRVTLTAWVEQEGE